MSWGPAKIGSGAALDFFGHLHTIFKGGYILCKKEPHSCRLPWSSDYGKLHLVKFRSVVDVPSRPGVTQRFLLLTPEKPKAAVILLAGGNGRLGISQDGSIRFLSGNFLVRARRLFTDKGFSVAVVDAPSDRQGLTLKGFRQTPQHVADIKAVIAWLKQQSSLPVWLVGTSHGTQSAAFIATELSASQGGPDGLVLTSTILSDDRERAVPEMPLQRIAVPVLVVHHEQDGCSHCPFSAIPGLMRKLDGAPENR